LAKAILFFRQTKIMGQHKVSLEQLATAAGDNAKAIELQGGIMSGQHKTMEGQLAAIEGQRRTMEDSVAVAKDTAEAANKNANVLMNSERAWVMAEMAFRGDIDGIKSGGRIIKRASVKGDFTDVLLYLSYWNDGGVPAWISDIKIWHSVFSGLPEHPVTDATAVYSHMGPEPIGVKARVTKQLLLECPGWDDGPSGMGMVLYGVINYRDVFGSELSTWFAYTITTNANFQRLAGFPEYNRHT
jgi:hypothetical protein